MPQDFSGLETIRNSTLYLDEFGFLYLLRIVFSLYLNTLTILCFLFFNIL